MFPDLQFRPAAVALLAALLAAPAAAEYAKTVEGTALAIGIVPARSLVTDPVERQQHGSALDGPAQHVLVSVRDAQTGAYAGDAAVDVELVDPRGGVQRKPLVRGAVSGIPDYSALFAFGWSGRYALRVSVAKRDGSRVDAQFTLDRVLP